MRIDVEFTVEPFVAGRPGPHVTAAIDATRAAGLEPDMGPFATTVSGAVEPTLDAVRALLAAALAEGASRVSVTVSRADGDPT